MIKQLLLMFLLLSLPVVAQQTMLEELEILKEQYNSNIDQVPSFVQRLFEDEIVQIDFIEDGKTFFAVLEDSVIKQITEEAAVSPTMLVRVESYALAQQLLAGESDPLTALDEGRITYTGIGFFKKIKIGFVKLGQKIVSLFV